MATKPLQITIEDTGLGVHIEGDTGAPGHRVWKISGQEPPAYILTRSAFHLDGLPQPAVVKRYVRLTENDIAGLTPEQIMNFVRDSS